MKKLFASCKELRINLKNSRGDSLLYPYLAKIFEPEIVIINKLRSFLKNVSEAAKVTAVRNTAAAREAEAAKEAAEYAKKEKKYREEAAALAAENEMIDKMTDEEFEEYIKSKEGN